MREPPADLRPLRVLIADDHRMVREGIVALLDAADGIEVVAQCGSGREAVALAVELAPDVAVVDLVMPGLNGIDATRQIRSAVEGTRVIALSMHGERHYVEAVLRAGASGYLLKGSGFDELVRAIRAVAAGYVFLSPEVTAEVVAAYVAPGDATGGSSFDMLTHREREVLQLIAEGLASREVAARLGISPKTVDSHRARIMKKLDLSSIADLTRYAIRQGLSPL